MAFKKVRFKICWVFLSFLLLSLTACDPFSKITSLERIQDRNEIIMGTINGSLTYAFDGLDKSGFDYEMGLKFAEYLNVTLRVKEYDSLEALFSALDDNEIDFIGAGLTLTPKRSKKYRSSPPYYYVSQTLVYHKGTYRPRKITDIKDPISVLRKSSHEEILQNLLKTVPNLKISEQEDEDEESLLRKVATKEIKFALVNSTTLAQKQRYYPVLAKAFTLSKNLPSAWLIKRNLDNAFYSAMIEFIGNKYQDQTIAKLTEKYFGHVESFDFVDTKVFLNRIKTVLPKYEELFKKYTTPEVNWALLAAVSYQESHWNPKAKSPTGVRGMMMLTRSTAKSLGIKNRLDVTQSVKGGAKYLSKLINRLPNSIAEDEKIWFALASYNIGYGHLMDARRITTIRKQNPDSWADVKDNLPLLHQKKWNKQTRYGYARGKEAQHYVNNIRQYNKTLVWYINNRAKEEAQKKADQAAKNKALAEKLEQQRLNPLTKEEALQQLKKEILVKEQALQQAKNKTIKIEEALQKIIEKTLEQDESLKLVQEHALALQSALKENEQRALAAQRHFQLTKEKIQSEHKILQKQERDALIKLDAYQQIKDKRLTEQAQYQRAKYTALAEQYKTKQDIEAALAEQTKAQQALAAEQLQAKQAEDDALNEDKVIQEGEIKQETTE